MPDASIKYTASYGDADTLVEDIWINDDCVGDLHHEDGVYLHACYRNFWPIRFASASAAKAWIAEHANYLERDSG